MAQDTPDRLKYFLSINTDKQDDLARIRHWNNLKIGYDDGKVWVKDLDYGQIQAIEVKSLPSKQIYYEKSGRLFPLGGLLPESIVPALLWTPIDRAIRATLPTLNHNFFGLRDHVAIQLIPHEQEVDVSIMITELATLAPYMRTAPSIRLINIRWIILNARKVLLVGKPLLPIPGMVCWNSKDMLIPAGYNFEFPILIDAIQKRINPGRDHLVLWDLNAGYSLIPKQDLLPLSRSSFRQSYSSIMHDRQ